MAFMIVVIDVLSKLTYRQFFPVSNASCDEPIASRQTAAWSSSAHRSVAIAMTDYR